MSRAYPAMAPRLPSSEAIGVYLRELDASHWYTNFGPLSKRLALRLAAHFGAPEGGVCLMANATLALAAVLQDAAEKRPGGVCLLPSWTFAASAHAIVLSGLEPHFVDVDAESQQLTPEIAETALTGKNVAAVMPVGAFGAHVDGAAWETFAAKHGVPVIIDAAAAFDTASVCALPTIVSLHATKPVAAGEGAFVLSTDTALIERLRRRSNFGFDAHRVAQMHGLNAKMSEYHAAVAHASLDRWPQLRGELMRIGARYRALLRGTGAEPQQGWSESWISTTLNVRLPATAEAGDVARRLAPFGVDARQWWGRGCHVQPAFAPHAREPLPATEHLARHVIGLPFSCDLAVTDIEAIVARLRKVMSETEAMRR